MENIHKIYIQLFTIFLILILFDVSVLYINRNMYNTQFHKINNSPLILDSNFLIYCLITYLLVTYILFYFIIYNKDIISIADAAILGILIYGIYNFTNKATIPKWGLYESIVDTSWGGLLFAIVTVITSFIFKIKIKV